MPKAAIFDLDGTLTTRDTLKPFLLGVALKSPSTLWRAPFLIWALAMHFGLRLRDNEWLKTYFARQLLGNMSEAVAQEHAVRFAERLVKTGLNSAVILELDRSRSNADYVVLATASLDIYVHEIAKRLGFTDVICTVLARNSAQRFTGELVGGNCYGPEKLKRIERYLSEKGVAWRDTSVYTDHHTDFELLKAAGKAFAVSPNRRLRAMLPAIDAVIL